MKLILNRTYSTKNVHIISWIWLHKAGFIKVIAAEVSDMAHWLFVLIHVAQPLELDIFYFFQ